MVRSAVLVSCLVALALAVFAVVLVILCVDFNDASELSCPLNKTVDLSNASSHPVLPSTLVLDGLVYPQHVQFDRNGTKWACLCSVQNCIQKCCPNGQIMSNGICRRRDAPVEVSSLPLYKGSEPLQDTAWNLNVQYGMDMERCEDTAGGFYLLDPSQYDEDEFYLQTDGKLQIQKVVLDVDIFCVDFIEELDNLSVLVCQKDNEKPPEYYSYGMIISMPFLLLTFLVYAFLPDRNLHGRSLMCYVVSLFMAYLLLVILQLRFQTEEFSDTSCRGLAISCYFFFMVSFFWMNVMSIDIWSAFSGMRAVTSNKRHAEQRRFLIYCAYAWGVPLLMAIIVSTLSFWANLPPDVWYNPGVSDGQCWFREGLPTLVYFYGPMAIIIVSNITFFVVTAFKINRVQRDTSMLRKDESKKHSYENDKQRFNLYLKLMLAMGINWSLEVISWATKWKTHSDAFWYITDFANALYGVFIFFIFVFKRNIWKMVKRRYYSLMGKPLLGRSTTQTGYSSRTTASSINNQTLVSTVDCKSVSEDNVIVTTQVP